MVLQKLSELKLGIIKLFTFPLDEDLLFFMGGCSSTCGGGMAPEGLCLRQERRPLTIDSSRSSSEREKLWSDKRLPEIQTMLLASEHLIDLDLQIKAVHNIFFFHKKLN